MLMWKDGISPSARLSYFAFTDPHLTRPTVTHQKFVIRRDVIECDHVPFHCICRRTVKSSD